MVLQVGTGALLGQAVAFLSRDEPEFIALPRADLAHMAAIGDRDRIRCEGPARDAQEVLRDLKIESLPAVPDHGS